MLQVTTSLFFFFLLHRKGLFLIHLLHAVFIFCFGNFINFIFVAKYLRLGTLGQEQLPVLRTYRFLSLFSAVFHNIIKPFQFVSEIKDS